MIQIKVKVGRAFGALFLAFSPLTVADAAFASEPTVITTQGGDDSSYQIPLSSPVLFMGQEYSSIYATTNAVITFGRPDGTYWDFPMTPSISLGSTDWVVFPWSRPDEHFIISYTDNAFQVDMAARPIWLQNTPEISRLILTGIINEDRTISFSYYLENTDAYEGLRFGVRTPSGEVQTLEVAGLYQSEVPPAEEGQIMEPTPEPSPDPQPTPPFVPDGATVYGEGQVVQIVSPQGKRIANIYGYYGDPNDSRNGLDVSSILAQFSGSESARIEANNSWFTDPAPGIVKVLVLLVTFEDIPYTGPTPEEIAAEEAAEAARLEAERIEAERIAAEQAAEAARLEAERLEAERLAAEEAARLEAERIAAEQAAEAARIEAERVAAERLAALEQAERERQERLAAEEARLEAERVAAEEAAKEKARLEADARAKAEAERLERERLEAEANKPTPTPTPTPTASPTTTPIPTPTPTPTPTENPVVVEIKEPITAENITAVVTELATIAPQDLTTEQQTLIFEAAMEVFTGAEQGSAEYEAALDALLVVAQADDIVVDEELAAIPLLGNAAVAAAEVFNALGNAGADMSPQVREQSEKVVIASVIVANIAITATSAATSAAAVAARRP